MRLPIAATLLALTAVLASCSDPDEATQPAAAPSTSSSAETVTTSEEAATNAATALGYESLQEWRADADRRYPGFEGVVDFTGGILTVLAAPSVDQDPAAYGQVVATSIAYQLSLQNLDAQLSGTSRAVLPIDAIVVLDPSGLKLAEHSTR